MDTKKPQKKAEEVTPEEEVVLTSVRAKDWEEIHGQSQVKTSVQIAIHAA